MAQDPTPDQVVEAARSLDQAEFTRADVAEKLGVARSDMREGFKEAKQSGRLVKTRNDEENTGHFKLP